MRFYSDVDTLVQRAFDLQESPVRAMDLRLISGEFCARCGSGRKTSIGWSGRGAPSQEVSVCWDCWAGIVDAHGEKARDHMHKAVWIGTARGEFDVLKNEVTIYPRAGAAEEMILDQIDESMRLRRVVFVRPHDWPKDRWGFALDAWKLWLHPQIGSYSTVATYGQENTLRYVGWWTAKRVRYWICEARVVVQYRAQRHPRLLARAAS